MANEIEVTIGGATYLGKYTVSGRGKSAVVTVEGNGLTKTKSPQLGELPDDQVAQLMLAESLQGYADCPIENGGQFTSAWHAKWTTTRTDC
ncbi:hypothetical protein [Jiella avicenniae]|uniref:Uncharacterized protein n=1 Tax=Jiella avicenniae TaxID=2907202 RepID=A0A9X1P445_9HYPH|nr:hypothetical protein [Jiella avicenniae]MCE7029389.1 hypothetical protein [Jiella avicenniae]